MHCNTPTHQSSHGSRGGTWWKGHTAGNPEPQNRTSSSSVPSEDESEEELEDAKLELSDGITEAGRTAFGWDRRRRLRPPGTVDPVGIFPASDKKWKNTEGAEQAPQSTNSGPDGFSTKKVFGVWDLAPNFQPHFVTPGDAKICKQRSFFLDCGKLFATQPFSKGAALTWSAIGTEDPLPLSETRGTWTAGGSSKSSPGRHPETTLEATCAL